MGPKLRKGFSTEVNWYALEARKSLGLRDFDPIDPWVLAETLGFKIFTIGKLIEICSDTSGMGLKIVSDASFSAVRVRLPDGGAWIIHNEMHGKKRQAANICHELAHSYLMHPMSPMLTEAGQRNIDQEHEKEAQRLGPALLVSEPAALHIARQGWSLVEASDRYGASEEVIRMRLNLTRAHFRVGRRAA